MKKILFFLALLPVFCFGQTSPFCGNYVTSAPLSYTNQSNITITGLSITATGNAACITLTNCTNVLIYNCKLTANASPNANSGLRGVLAYNSSGVTVRKCLITKVSAGVVIESFSGANANETVDSCQLQNMCGSGTSGHAIQFSQITGAGGVISNNIIENLAGSSSPSDAISVYESNGTASSNIRVFNNQIRETGTSAYTISAGGILLGDGFGSYQSATSNILVNTGHFLYGIGTGTYMTIANNQGYLKDPVVPNVVGVQIANLYTGTTCANITVTSNQIYCYNTTTNTLNPYWIPVPPSTNACTPVTNTGNTWNDASLSPSILPSVLIPTCSIPAPVLSYSPNAYTFYVNTTIPAINITNTGGICSSYTCLPAQPNGILFSTSTAQFSGVPLFVTPQTTMTVAGTNAGGQNSTVIKITIIDRQPNISFSPSTQVCTLGVPITNMVPSNSGGAIVSATCTPALPPGLTCNPVTAVIGGTATTLSPVTNYVVTAFNSGGGSPYTITLSVVPPAPAAPVVVYNPNSFVFPINQLINPIYPISTGGAVASYSINTPVPTGLTFSTVDGSVQGTPTANSATQTYSITAHNITGTYTTPLTLSVVTVLPPAPSITYQPSSIALQINVASPVLIPMNTGGTASGGYTITPSLPASMSIDPVTGFISGVPGVLSNPVVYDIAASNPGGVGHFSLTLSVVPPNPGQIIRIPAKNAVLVYPP